jgi:uncharacterized protein YggE
MRIQQTTCYAALFVIAAAATAAAEEHVERTIRVTGAGQATAPPDMATVQTGVVTQAEKARDALDQNNAAMQRVMAALKSQKIADKDIQTSNFDVRPQYKRGPRGQQQPEIANYRVSNQVRVRVRNLPELGQVLDALVGAGSNQIAGVSFSIDDPTGVLNQARTKAIADARSRAQLYAQAAGVGVGKVLSISEQTAVLPRPQYLGRAIAAEGAGAVPVATGEQEVRATIQVVFQLVDED